MDFVTFNASIQNSRVFLSLKRDFLLLKCYHGNTGFGTKFSLESVNCNDIGRTETLGQMHTTSEQAFSNNVLQQSMHKNLTALRLKYIAFGHTATRV